MWTPLVSLMLCGTLGSVVVFAQEASITSTFTADKNWKRINENFPSTASETHPDQIDQFYYLIGPNERKFNLSDLAVGQIERSKQTTNFHVSMKYWTNVFGCARSIYLYPNQTSERLLLGQWTSVERSVSYDQIHQFYMLLYAGDALGQCDQSVFALKQIECKSLLTKR